MEPKRPHIYVSTRLVGEYFFKFLLASARIPHPLHGDKNRPSPEFPADFLPPFLHSAQFVPLSPHLSSNDASPCAKRTDNGKKCVNKKCIRNGKNAPTRAHSGHCYCMCPVATYTTALTSDPAHFKGTNICFFVDRSTSHHNI